MKEGKVIQRNSLQGLIEYDLNNRIYYDVAKHDEFNVGDIVGFEIEIKGVNETNDLYRIANNLNLIKKRNPLNKSFFRLNKLAKIHNCSISKIVEILHGNGFNLDSKPNTKIYEEEYLIIENHFNLSPKKIIPVESSLFEKGTVVRTNIVSIIPPSLIIVEFFNKQNALLPLNNLSWNKSRSEKILKSAKIGDELQVVVLEIDSTNPIVSQKHLIPRPSETEFWKEIKLDSILKGKVFEILINKVIIELENGFFGIVTKPLDFKNKLGDKLSFKVTSKNEYNLYLFLSISVESNSLGEITIPRIENELVKVKSDFVISDKDLETFEKFSESIYYNFCDDFQEEFISTSFSQNPFLFASSINIEFTMCIQFDMNLPAWESSFKNKLVPYLSAGETIISDRDALDYLAKQKYWLRINRFVKYEIEKIQWVLFNEEYFISGYVHENTNDFIVLSLSIQRTEKNRSIQKTRSLSAGTFLYDSEIVFLSPFQNKPNNSDQKQIFKLLDDKTKAFGIINTLKKKSGALLLEEGLSLQIFDRFLEFQENLLKKDNVSNRVMVEAPFKRVTSELGKLSIQLPIDLSELCNNDASSALVTIRTVKSSTKKSREEEFVFFSEAMVEIIPEGANLHFKSDDISLDDLKKGFYLEPKISLKQFQVQREVLQDFFSKKIKLEHVESLLLKPEKIKPPDLLSVNFFNEILNETEKKNPNNNQVKSVKKSIGNKNIFLVQGPPGTGKTTVIAEIVQQLAKKNEKILVTSQTHIAVDNVLEKVSEVKNLSCLRLGNIEKVKPELGKYHKDKQIEIYTNYFIDSIKLNILLANYFIKSNGELTRIQLTEIAENEHVYPDAIKVDLILRNIEFIDSLLQLEFDKIVDLPTVLGEWSKSLSIEQEALIMPLIYSTLDVVFATCIGVRTDRDLSDYNVVFDTVIIDEAGKANLSESIAAISMAKKIILVGDQMQLPPYIDGTLLDTNEKNSFPNSKYGSKFLDNDIQHALRTSFFEFLVNRIKGGIFPSSNIEMLNYQHRMHPDIGQFISDAFYEGRVKMGEKTIENILHLPTPFDKQIVFLDTSTADDPFETKDGISVKNDTEAQCISQLVVPHLLKSGLSVRDFAIVAPYKSQVANIKRHLSDMDSGINNQIDVSTLDSFQGMEFDVIVFSFTRSDRNSKVGFLDDARRLNVAFSRAKKKLILIGNSETLTDSKSHYDQLFDYTKLFKKLVKLAKDERLGNFVNVTDFTDLKSRFQSQIEKYKVANIYNCQPKLTFEKPNFNGHIFYIEGSTLVGMFKDDEKIYDYDSEIKYKMYIQDIDYENERIYLSPKQSTRSVFFKENKVGNKLKAKYKSSIKAGHFFEIEFGFDCFEYDPKHIKKYIIGVEYELFIIKLDQKEGRISVSDAPFTKRIRTQKKKSNSNKRQSFNRDAQKLKFFNSNSEGDIINVKFENSVEFGHFFELSEGFNGLLYDPKIKHKGFIKGNAYNLEIIKMDNQTGKVSLGLKNK